MNHFFSRMIKAGLIVATLDILAAFINYYIRTGNNPLFVLEYIASGIFGKDAFNGGTTMMIAGLVFHYCIAYAFTVFYFLLHEAVPFLSRYKVVSGVLYGIFTWSVMQFFVLPLSNVSMSLLEPVRAVIAILILIVCIGLPLAFMANAFAAKDANNKKGQQVSNR